MNRKLVITQVKNQIMSAVYEDDVLTEFIFDPFEHQIMGNIYIGKVKQLSQNINAAFVEFAKGQSGYYSLNENPIPLFTQPNRHCPLVQGDELIVQVYKENIKTKLPALTSRFTLNSSALVLTAGKPLLSFSNRIENDKVKAQLKILLTPLLHPSYGFIVRTQAIHLEPDEILRQARNLIAEYEAIIKKGQYRTCYSLIHESVPAYFEFLQKYPGQVSVVTDLKAVYQHILSEYHAEDLSWLKLYEDDQWPLIKVYSLTTHLTRAMDAKVWLKSGGYLVIQPTEALVSIDVNTGKFTGKKTPDETYFKINIEAAQEVAHQLRLRNLSGIIMIDFIDMKSGEYRKALLDELKSALGNDPLKTVVYGMTRLNLVEMTRKKERRPLYEQFKKAEGFDE